VRFTDGARSHGINEADARNAIANSFRWFDIDGGEMLIGTDTHGRFLEVGLRTANNGETIVFHVMPARPKFLR
jgi:hypothetical protein